MRPTHPPRPARPLLPGEAHVDYLDGDLRVLSEGQFVVCAVSGKPIPLDELKYWNVDRQEPYASLAIAVARWRALNGGGAA